MAELKDSGSTREFETGSHRDCSTGKGRCDLLPVKEVLDVINIMNDENPPLMTKKQLLDSTLKEILCYMEDYEEEKVNNILRACYYAAIADGIDESYESHDVEEKTPNGYFAYGIMQVSKHYEQGALKYGENNWRKGMPLHVYLDCALRHLLKSIAGMKDEPHIRAVCWNLLCFLWTKSNRPNLNDLKGEWL